MTWFMVAGWFVGWVLLWKMPRLRATRDDTSGLRVSVVIPVRNEVDRIPLLLTSLQHQGRRPEQVIVVDDGSDDGSPDVVRAFPGVELVTANPPPTGWTGKSWACTTGVRQADGDVLVFLDADVVLEHDALAQLLSTWSTQGGLVSVQPEHRIKRSFEAFSMLFNVIAVMGLGVGSLLPPRKEWGASGPCMVTSRADYDLMGGHAAVAGEIAEDLALAECYGAGGLSVRCFGGSGQIWFRMYRNGHDLFQGWTKNVATGARHTPVLRALGVAAWMTALISVLILLVTSPATVGWPVIGLLYVATAFQVAILGSRVGRFGLAGLVWPVLVVAFLVIFFVSIVQSFVLRRAWWSGRSIPMQRHG